MATPLFDIQHLMLARRLKDPVATGATAGVIYTVANRSQYLNQANTLLVSTFYYRDTTPQKTKVRQQFQSLVTSAAITFAAGGSSFPADYNQMPLGVTKDSDTTMFTFHASKEELDNNVNPNIPNAWTISGAKIYAYQAGAQLTSGTGKIYYLINDEVTEAGATDIAISSRWNNVIVDLATAFALSEKAQTSLNPQVFTERAKMQTETVV